MEEDSYNNEQCLWLFADFKKIEKGKIFDKKGFNKKSWQNNVNKSIAWEEFNPSRRNEKDPKLKQAKEVPIT